MQPLLALVDCNNFYVSCERVFRPDLIGKPVAVLSNNDGCIVARSQEVKDLGEFQKLIYPSGGSNQDIPFRQDWVTFQSCFNRLHGHLGQ